MRKTLFYASMLPNLTAKRLYSSVLKGVAAGENSVETNGLLITDKQICQTLEALDRDYPELFYVSFFGNGASIQRFSSGRVVVRFAYRYSPREQSRRIAENKRVMDYLLSHIPPQARKSQYLTALWLHDLVAQNVVYDRQASEEGSEKHSRAYTIEGGMLGKKAVCSGIARLYMMLCERSNLWCTYVAGEAIPDAESQDRPGLHAWNLLRLDNSYAWADVTWDLMRENYPVVPHDFFGMSDEQCFRQHRLDTSWRELGCLKCLDPNPLNYYHRRGCLFSSLRALELYLGSIQEKRQEIITFQMDAPPHGAAYDESGVIKELVKKKLRGLREFTLWHRKTMGVYLIQAKYYT